MWHLQVRVPRMSNKAVWSGSNCAQCCNRIWHCQRAVFGKFSCVAPKMSIAVVVDICGDWYFWVCVFQHEFSPRHICPPYTSLPGQCRPRQMRSGDGGLQGTDQSTKRTVDLGTSWQNYASLNLFMPRLHLFVYIPLFIVVICCFYRWGACSLVGQLCWCASHKSCPTNLNKHKRQILSNAQSIRLLLDLFYYFISHCLVFNFVSSLLPPLLPLSFQPFTLAQQRHN